jgi:branched-chain amino acid transport system substrate-binding protein
MRLALVAALAAALFGAEAYAQGTQTPVKLGVLNDQSSSFAAFSGKGSVEAARLAIEDHGGKALGKPIELISADHQNKPDVGLAIARQWFDKDGVDVVVDIANSAIALGVNNLLKEEKKLGLFLSAAGAGLRSEAHRAHAQRAGDDQRAEAGAGVRDHGQGPEDRRDHPL